MRRQWLETVSTTAWNKTGSQQFKPLMFMHGWSRYVREASFPHISDLKTAFSLDCRCFGSGSPPANTESEKLQDTKTDLLHRPNPPWGFLILTSTTRKEEQVQHLKANLFDTERDSHTHTLTSQFPGPKKYRTVIGLGDLINISLRDCSGWGIIKFCLGKLVSLKFLNPVPHKMVNYTMLNNIVLNNFQTCPCLIIIFYHHTILQWHLSLSRKTTGSKSPFLKLLHRWHLTRFSLQKQSYTTQ